jgi:hypothetical protein
VEIVINIDPSTNIDFNEIDILSIHDFDTNYCWDNPEVPEEILSFAP